MGKVDLDKIGDAVAELLTGTTTKMACRKCGGVGTCRQYGRQTFNRPVPKPHLLEVTRFHCTQCGYGWYSIRRTDGENTYAQPALPPTGQSVKIRMAWEKRKEIFGVDNPTPEQIADFTESTVRLVNRVLKEETEKAGAK